MLTAAVTPKADILAIYGNVPTAARFGQAVDQSLHPDNSQGICDLPALTVRAGQPGALQRGKVERQRRRTHGEPRSDLARGPARGSFSDQQTHRGEADFLRKGSKDGGSIS